MNYVFVVYLSIIAIDFALCARMYMIAACPNFGWLNLQVLSAALTLRLLAVHIFLLLGHYFPTEYGNHLVLIPH